MTHTYERDASCRVCGLFLQSWIFFEVIEKFIEKWTLWSTFIILILLLNLENFLTFIKIISPPSSWAYELNCHKSLKIVKEEDDYFWFRSLSPLFESCRKSFQCSFCHQQKTFKFSRIYNEFFFLDDPRC